MIRRVQKIGNSKGIVLTRTMLAHIGAGEDVDITMEEGRIVITAVRETSPRRKQTFEEAKQATFAQYDDTLRQLANS